MELLKNMKTNAITKGVEHKVRFHEIAFSNTFLIIHLSVLNMKKQR